MSVQANPSDIATLGPNIAIFVVAVIASIAGVYQALQKLKAGEQPQKGASSLQAGVILDNVSMTLWSESNRTVAESNQAVIRSNESLKASNYAIRDRLIELTHQVERLRDEMERRR